MQISVDGKLSGTRTVSSTGTYGTYYSTNALSDGLHTVKIGFSHDKYVAGRCDRNLYVGSAAMEDTSTITPPPVVNNTKPGATNTGVPVGTRLTVVNGDLNVTKNGTVIDSMDIHGFVKINANNVTIKRSIVRGGAPSSVNSALVSNYGN